MVSNNIEYSSAMDKKEKAPELIDYSGLGLVDFYVVPHHENRGFKKAVQEIISHYASDLELVIINDQQAVFVEDDKMSVIESGKKF